MYAYWCWLVLLPQVDRATLASACGRCLGTGLRYIFRKAVSTGVVTVICQLTVCSSLDLPALTALKALQHNIVRRTFGRRESVATSAAVGATAKAH